MKLCRFRSHFSVTASVTIVTAFNSEGLTEGSSNSLQPSSYFALEKARAKSQLLRSSIIDSVSSFRTISFRMNSIMIFMESMPK